MRGGNCTVVERPLYYVELSVVCGNFVGIVEYTRVCESFYCGAASANIFLMLSWD